MTGLCALQDVKTYKAITSSGQDTVITALIAAASAFIETYCGRTFASTAYTETRNGNGASAIMCRQRPIISVQSVSVDGVSVPKAPDVYSYGYAFDDSKIYLRGYGRMTDVGPVSTQGYPATFSRGLQNIVLEYTAGFANIPADLNQACVELVCWKLAKRERIDQTSETLGQQQTQAFDKSDMPAGVKTTLKKYLVTMIAP